MEKEYVMQSKQPKKEKTQTMGAITLDNFDSSPGLRQDLPAPTPADNEVLVRVRASSVSPVDNSVAAGMLKDMVEHEFPVTLGRDFAGVVEQAGSEVSGLSEGDEVFGFITGMSPAVHEGTWAELIAVPESSATRKPEGVDTASAGAAPLAAITAMSALDALGVSEGDTVLVVGANGGVGSFAVQLAANAGARVIAPGLPEDEEYLKDLGVSEVLPRDADIAALVHERYPEGIEALLDLVSYAPEGFDTHAEVLKDDGRGASSLSAAGEGSERHNVMAMPTPEHLQRLARLLEAGTLRVPIQRSYELDQAADALHALSAEHTQGKLAIRVA
jgi:NADPH:quinone reductase